ncbi:MAG: hypothetical protein JKY48_08325 [Flavobacteriales bacterium]|nr:hypothetical protein [Flavobacteriales bacterium]
MKTIKVLLLATILISAYSCSTDDEIDSPTNTNQSSSGLSANEYQCETGNPRIIGARCNDGTRSNATGQGACSRQGGVKYWICSN